MGFASARRNGRGTGKRSGLEVKVDAALKAAGIKFKYEGKKFTYIQPEQKRTYLADFPLDDYPDIVIESKGRFTSADRKKMLLLQAQYPNTKFIMVFGRSQNTLSKSSKTTYGAWCDKHELPWLDITKFLADPKQVCQFSITKKQKTGTLKLPTKRKN